LILGARASSLFEAAIKTASALFRQTGREEFKQQVFEFVEKAKARVLLATLQESQARNFAGIPNNLLQQEQDLRQAITKCDLQLQKEKTRRPTLDSLKVQSLQNKLISLRWDFQKLIQGFEQDYPDYFSLKHQTRTVNVADIQPELDSETMFIEYFMGEQ